MKKVTLYARVSTADQHSGLESQIRALKEYCGQSQITDYDLYTDENFSGAKVSRPGLDRMMAAVKSGLVKCVVVYSFSRFARSTTHLLTALEEMKKHETDFISITERIETNSPMGRAFFTVIAAIAQLERELIVERVKNGLKNARANGKRIGRAKTRPSEIIRALLKSGLTLRETARIAKTSHGSVSLEKKIMKQEEEAQNKIEAERKAQEVKEQAEKELATLDCGLPQFSTHISMS